MPNAVIDGQEYDLETLSDNARGQLGSLRVADQEIAQLQSRMALTQTARNAYAGALAADLPAEHTGPVEDDLKTVTVDGKKYRAEDFSEGARQQITMLRLTDQRLTALQAELAMIQTARNTYATALKAALPAS